MRKSASISGVVAVAFPSITEAELAVLEGIKSGLAAVRGLEILVLSGGYEGALRRLVGMKELAGAIGDFVSEAWLLPLREGGVRVVQLAQCSRIPSVPNVEPDFVAMGQGAAQALRADGAGEYVFIGSPGQYASERLLEGFSREVEPFAVVSGVSQAQIREALRQVPGPLGVFAGSDRQARLAVGAARELGRRIPDDVAVIGVGDDRLESLYAGIPLSSYALPGRELGRIAADCLLGNAAATELRPVGILHERKSSLRSPTGLDRALIYARSNLEEPLQVADLCRIAGMSRRSFETAMQNAHGTSPSRYLEGLRRERAETLLTTTAQSVQEIARLCGYPEPCVFSTAFRRWTGRTPSEFRRG